MAIKRLSDARVGDCVIEHRPVLRRITRTMRYQQVGTDTVRGTIVEAAASHNRWSLLVQFPDGIFVRNNQFIEVE